MMIKVLLGATAATAVNLATFDGAAGTTFKFVELNDPVMGGRSTGTWKVDTQGNFGVFDGSVLDVPSLKAPGFIKTAADGKFPDASSTLGGDLVLSVRSSTPEYAGFRVAFVSGTLSAAYACSGGGSIPLSRGCYKNKFSVPAGSDFTEVRIPLDSFSDLWSPATGEQTKTCAEDSSACVTAKVLGSIQRVEVWAEGALGNVHLEVQSISAEPKQGARTQLFGAAPVKGASPPAEYGLCKGPVQTKLRYGASGRDTPAGIPVAVNEDESLAEAVCCDSRTLPFAEPQFLYQAPDINLFAKLDENAVTTFYDSVCGLPLFRSPVNRTFADFKADTDEHGWPSFRSAEIFAENLVTDEETGFVRSSCGTHIGSYLPDEQGPRWCIDTICISGNPATEVL